VREQVNHVQEQCLKTPIDDVTPHSNHLPALLDQRLALIQAHLQQRPINVHDPEQQLAVVFQQQRQCAHHSPVNGLPRRLLANPELLEAKQIAAARSPELPATAGVTRAPVFHRRSEHDNC
jgi:hypothetical protein